jgi:Uma2 family endonuclease
MATTTRLKTYDDLCRAREDGNRYELIEGVLILVAGPSSKHQRIHHRLLNAFDAVVIPNSLGEVFYAPFDVRLAAHTYVQPDLMVVLSERLDIVGDAFIDGPPDLVVEIFSPSSRARDQGQKAQLYARYGAREYWTVEPETRTITIHAESDGERYQRVEQVRDVARSVVVPGLTIDLATLFANLP